MPRIPGPYGLAVAFMLPNFLITTVLVGGASDIHGIAVLSNQACWLKHRHNLARDGCTEEKVISGHGNYYVLTVLGSA